MKNFRARYIVIPLVIIDIILIITAILCKNGVFSNDNSNEIEWNIKTVQINRGEYSEIAVMKKWEDREIYQKFYNLEHLDTTYNSRPSIISDENIGEYLETVIMVGTESYTDIITHTINASVYKINEIKEECAVAVQFEGDDNYYAYINAYYKPETLENLIEDLNLKELLSFGTVYYDYKYTDSKGNTKYENIEFPDVEDETIWSMLFDELNVKNIYSDSENYGNKVMSVSVDIPMLGYENISVWVTEDGYLLTNILDTGKGFYIGEDKVNEFVSYIIENYEGYKTVYIDENGEEINEEDFVEEDETEGNETIMVTENTANGMVTSEVTITNNSTNNSTTSSTSSSNVITNELH